MKIEHIKEIIEEIVDFGEMNELQIDQYASILHKEIEKECILARIEEQENEVLYYSIKDVKQGKHGFSKEVFAEWSNELRTKRIAQLKQELITINKGEENV